MIFVMVRKVLRLFTLKMQPSDDCVTRDPNLPLAAYRFVIVSKVRLMRERGVISRNLEHNVYINSA